MPKRDSEIMKRIDSVRHWYHRIELKPGIVTPGVHDSAGCLNLLDLPASCKGMRVLDLGARDGFFSFELERRGAKVVAVDYQPNHVTGFQVAAELLNSKVTYIQDNIYRLTAEKYGTFDIVLFLGLIYHLPDPLGALGIARSMCRDRLYLETHAIDNGLLMPNGTIAPLGSISKILHDIPIMQFYPANSLNNDPSNFWGPNVKCMEQMLVASNFSVLTKTLHGSRAIFKCRVTVDGPVEYHYKIARGIWDPGEIPGR